MHRDFIDAIHSKNKICVTFYSKEDGAPLIRVCAPMDYGPSKSAKNQRDRFHVWDYESDSSPHPLSLLPEQIIRIEILEDTFDPAEFVTWKTAWIVARDWGLYS